MPTFNEIQEMRATDYNKGFCKGLTIGIIVASVLLGLVFSYFLMRLNTAIADEALATNYYYQLSQNK